MRGTSGVRAVPVVRPAGQLFGAKTMGGAQSGPSPSLFGPQTQATAQTMGPQSAINSNTVLQNNQSPTGFMPSQPGSQYQAVAPVYGIGSFAPISQQPPAQYPPAPADTGIPWATIAIGGAIGVAAIVAIAVLFPAQP